MSSGKYLGKESSQTTGTNNSIYGSTITLNPATFGQSINLAPLDNMNSSLTGHISMQDLFGHDPSWHPDVKKYEVYESPEDTLALSVAWKRLKDKSFKTNFSSLLDRQLFEFVNEEDKIIASAIRDYYSKKIMMLNLKNDRPLTKFRKDLSKYIQSSGSLVQQKELGMIYYLPYFYEYDCNLDYVKSTVDLHPEFINIPRKTQVEVTKHLTPIKKIYKNQKRVKTYQYWFKDEDNVANMLQFETSNPLLHIWDYNFDNNSKIAIFGTYNSFSIDNMFYYRPYSWRLVQT